MDGAAFLHWKDEWNYVLEELGAQYVVTDGVLLMLELFAEGWATARFVSIGSIAVSFITTSVD